MSNNVNTRLIERAYELTEHNKYNFMTVKGLVASGDLDQLREFVIELENRKRDFEFQNDDPEVYGSEEMQERADSIRDAMREDGIPF